MYCAFLLSLKCRTEVRDRVKPIMNIMTKTEKKLNIYLGTLGRTNVNIYKFLQNE